MELIVLNKTERDLVRGEYKKGHIIEPIEVDADTYVLNKDAMQVIKPILKKAKYNPIVNSTKSFVVGDKSAEDVKYKAKKEKDVELIETKKTKTL